MACLPCSCLKGTCTMTPLTSEDSTPFRHSTCGCTLRGGLQQGLGCGWRCWAVTGQVRPAFPLQVSLTWSCDPGFPGCPGRRSDHDVVDGQRGQPSPVKLCQLETLPTSGPAMISCLKPWALQPQDWGQFFKGCALSFLKDHFSSPTPVSQKQIITTHHPPKFN